MRSLNRGDDLSWIGRGGPFTPLHHGLTSNLLIQAVDLSTDDAVFIPIGWWHQVRA